MSAPPQHVWTREDYDRDAREYLASLPLEHFMESTPQSTQREISVASFALLRERCPLVRYFSELLIQLVRQGEVIRVVPDNMVVLGPLDDDPRSSYAVDLEPYPVFWTLEYVSESNRRKDYVDSFEKYEAHLRVPYYLIFDPEHQDLRLYHHQGSRYAPVEANAAGRYPIPELELEAGLLAGWVRYWYRGELLPLPVELSRQMRQLGEQLLAAREALGQREKELQKSQEDVRQRDSEVRQRDEEIIRNQEEGRRREAELLHSQEELRQRDSEILRNREELRQRDAENLRIQEEGRRREAELLHSQEELRQRDTEILRSREELRQRDAENLRIQEEARRREVELRQRQESEQAMVAALRSLVEARARQVGRQDILEQLSSVDGQRLTQWLAELS